MKKIVTICGPTGVGKTGFAIALAKKFNGEIIGADSMQIYKYLDIGTAKPDRAERAMAVHHLVDFLDPKSDFDAGKFAQMASAAIEDVLERGKLPIVAGGTGLYIRALLHGLFRDNTICADTLARLEDELEKEGVRPSMTVWPPVIPWLPQKSTPMTDSGLSGPWRCLKPQASPFQRGSRTMISKKSAITA